MSSDTIVSKNDVLKFKHLIIFFVLKINRL